MSGLSEWDNELGVVAREIQTLREAHSKQRLTGNKALVARKIAIIQAQINLERNLERLKKLVERDFLLLPREKTMLHWGQIYLDRVTQHFHLKTKLLTRGLWLKLIKTRLMGPDGGGPHEIDADDLVALAIRQANLSKTEKYLADQLVRLRKLRRELQTRYEQLGIAEANRTASASLGSRLGPTPELALKSPELRALEGYVRRVTAPVTAVPAQERFELAQARYEAKTEGLLGIARSLVVSRIKDGSAKPSSRVLDKYQLAMQQLADLEDETRLAYDQILGTTPDPAHPVVK